jgi:DEAD/DEAH box helicase domain-containing protein
MKVSVGVTWSTREKAFRQYTEGQVPSLLKQLFNADMVVGFNNINFDNEVLRPYGGGNPDNLKSLDLLEEITRSLGHRLTLDSVAQSTLNTGKAGDGKQAVTLWREGKLAQLLSYCQKDVELTRDLWLFGRQYGYLLYEKREQGLMRLSVNW